jgi:hypothetical protein
LLTITSRYIVLLDDTQPYWLAEDHMATAPDLRIGDADREAVAESLREHYAQGRLTLEEFNQRLDAVFAATKQSQLSAITRDLPHAAVPSAPLPVTAAWAGRERAWHDYRARGRRRLGMIPVIIAMLAAWLLILDLNLRAFPWPGKLAIFLAIFGLARGLLRRVFGIGRGRRPGRPARPRRPGRYRGGPQSGGPWSGGSWSGGLLPAC